MPLRASSRKLKYAPCTDMTPVQMASSSYMKRYFHGLYEVKLGNEEIANASTNEYMMSLNNSYYNLLPGPNKTESLLEAGEFYKSGGWHRAMAAANFILGPGIPHPRGLTGLHFLGFRRSETLGRWRLMLPANGWRSGRVSSHAMSGDL